MAAFSSPSRGPRSRGDTGPGMGSGLVPSPLMGAQGEGVKGTRGWEGMKRVRFLWLQRLGPAVSAGLPGCCV